MEVSVSDIYDPDTSIYCLFINNEPILRITSDITPGDHFFPFFTGLRQDQTKITGGTSATIADYPWQVFYESGNYTCGASIISGDWIITAAHCTEDDFGNLIPASQMDVIVGANNPRSGLEGKKYLVSKVIRHENYDPVTLNNDIALLQLTATINYENATPIRLVSKIDSASGATDPGVMSWVTGYGLTKVSPANRTHHSSESTASRHFKCPGFISLAGYCLHQILWPVFVMGIRMHATETAADPWLFLLTMNINWQD